MNKAVAEFIGTFALVLVGCGAAVIGGMGSGATSVDALGIGAAFGLTIVAMAYGIGQISGCHINPAVSFGVWTAGRMSTADLITYVIGQVLGAIAGAAVLYLILSGKASGWGGSLGQNGWGPGYLGEYNVTSAFIYEVLATFLFLVCILGVTQRGAPVGLAGLAIGLTLVALHLWGINITGTSLNPARSLGPALVGAATNPQALAQLWLFIVAPLIGGAIAVFVVRAISVPIEPVGAAAGPVDETGVQLPQEEDGRDSQLPRARTASDADLPQRERRPQ
jgi:aquaporin Z